MKSGGVGGNRRHWDHSEIASMRTVVGIAALVKHHFKDHPRYYCGTYMPAIDGETARGALHFLYSHASLHTTSLHFQPNPQNRST